MIEGFVVIGIKLFSRGVERLDAISGEGGK